MNENSELLDFLDKLEKAFKYANPQLLRKYIEVSANATLAVSSSDPNEPDVEYDPPLPYIYIKYTDKRLEKHMPKTFQGYEVQRAQVRREYFMCNPCESVNEQGN